MSRRATTALVVLLMVAGAGACANGDGDTEGAVSLDGVHSATIDLEFAGRSLEGDAASAPVGFRLQGPFSFGDDDDDGGADYPVMRLAYTRLLGGNEQRATVTSTGDAVFVERDGKVVRVPPAQLGGLRMGDGDDTSGLEQLRVDAWVDGARRQRRGATFVVTGKVDVPNAFADLAALARQLGVPDAGDVARLDDKGRARLAQLVRSSEITIVSDASDDRLRSLDLRVDVGAGSASDRAELATLVGARLTLHLALADVNEPVATPSPPRQG